MIDLPKLLVRQEMVASFLGLRPHNNFLRIRNQSPEFEFICSWGAFMLKIKLSATLQRMENPPLLLVATRMMDFSMLFYFIRGY